MTAITICRPAGLPIRRITRCPTCERRRRFAAVDQPWYGPTWICLACGDRWSDGERLPRPFKRAWRAESRAQAARYWSAGVRAWSSAHMAWLEAEMSDDEPERAIEDVPTRGLT